MIGTTMQNDARPDPAALLRPADSPTHLVFEHRLFAAKGAAFEIDAATGTPSLCVDLGDVVAHIDLDAIGSSFGIAADSSDAQMLELVRRALAHVQRIEPGDAIPSEILDGAASWRIEPHHLLVSEGRISASLLAWMGDGHGGTLEPAALIKLAEDPQTKTRLREAFTKLAEHMGLPASRRGEVLGRVATLAKELAYIEALRERSAAIERIRTKLRELHRQYRTERKTAEEIDRALKLMAPPLERFSARFDDLDGQTGETANVMPNLPTAIAFIRKARDELRAEFVKWDAMVELWSNLAPTRSALAERAIVHIYRFLARTYPITQEWTRHA
jgi:hypothetical protein